MHYSGVLIRAEPDLLDTCLERVATVPGVDVQFVYPQSGRAIAVLESETLEAQQETLRTVQRLPHVVVAELVYHRILDDASGATAPSSPRRLETV